MLLLRDRRAELESAGVSPFGISRDSPWSHVAWQQALDLDIPLLSDWNAEAVRAFGVGARLPGARRRRRALGLPHGRRAHDPLREDLRRQRDPGHGRARRCGPRAGLASPMNRVVRHTLTAGVDWAPRFYELLFGWEPRVEPGEPPHWVSWVHVEDVERSAARAEELGGTARANGPRRRDRHRPAGRRARAHLERRPGRPRGPVQLGRADDVGRGGRPGLLRRPLRLGERPERHRAVRDVHVLLRGRRGGRRRDGEARLPRDPVLASLRRRRGHRRRRRARPGSSARTSRSSRRRSSTTAGSPSSPTRPARCSGSPSRTDPLDTGRLPCEHMFGCERDDPARRPGRLLRVGRAAGRPAPARTAGDRRRRRRPRRELRGEGVRHPHCDGRRARPAPLPRRDRRRPAHVGLRGGEQGRLPGLRGHDAARRGALDRRGVPRRARDGAARRARRPRSRCGCGAACSSEVGLPITVGIARTKFLAKVASGVAKPDGLLVVPPDRELAFLHPLPVERLWGVGQVTAGKLHAAGVTTVGEVARLGEPALVSLLGRGVGPAPPRARPQPRPAARPRRPPPGLDRLAARARAEAEVGARRSTRSWSASSTASPAGCAPPGGSAARSSSACASPTSPARPARTRCPGRRPRPRAILATARGLLASALPLIERQGLTLVGISVGNLEDGRLGQLTLPFDRRRGGALDAALDEVRDRFGTGRDHPRRPPRPRPGPLGAAPSGLRRRLVVLAALRGGRSRR